MPIFHLHLRYDDQLIKDLEGSAFANIAAARAEARSAIRDIIIEDIESNHRVSLRSIEICDENG
jgi:hypothetical protein